MPMMRVVGYLNGVLGSPGTPAYDQAKRSVESADSVAEAFVNAQDNLAIPAVVQDEVGEARAVFSALPPAVDESIRAALKSAFSREAQISLGWIELLDGPMQAHVHEGEDGRVIIQLSSPSGDTFT